MRTTIIPAQITTVEDKIAGSLNMTQILILMFPVLWTALIYVLLPSPLKLTPYKIGLILICVALCVTLAFRIKDKIVAEWLGVVLRYQLRPRFWVFNKNDRTGRVIDVPDIPDIALIPRKAVSKHRQPKPSDISVAELVKLRDLLDSGKVAIRYQYEKK